MKDKVDPFIPALLLWDEIDILSPNSPELDLACAKMLMTPDYSCCGVTHEALKAEYLKQCRMELEARFQKCP